MEIGNMCAATQAIITATPRIERDLEYTRRDGQILALDAYLPPDTATARAAVAAVHGGRWCQLDKRLLAPEACGLALKGYVVFAIDCRMLNGELALPSQIDNVRAALRWIQQQADRFRTNPERVGMLGGSAGGQLSSLAALQTHPEDPRRRIKAAVIWSGFFDLNLSHQRNTAMFAQGVPPVQLAIGCSPDECPDKYEAFSPITYVTPQAPPMLITCSTDEVSPLADSEAMAKWLQAAGVACELVVLQGNLHMRQYVPLVWDTTIQSLREHL